MATLPSSDRRPAARPCIALDSAIIALWLAKFVEARGLARSLIMVPLNEEVV
jgi:hypothetical protein